MGYSHREKQKSMGYQERCPDVPERPDEEVSGEMTPEADDGPSQKESGKRGSSGLIEHKHWGGVKHDFSQKSAGAEPWDPSVAIDYGGKWSSGRGDTAGSEDKSHATIW
jgi:hypothetical protein